MFPSPGDILDHFSQQNCSNQFWRLSWLNRWVWVMPQHFSQVKGVCSSDA